MPPEKDSRKKNLKMFGKIFRMQRIKKGYSLRGIARSVNMAHTIISDIENGKIYPNIETLRLIFKHVDVDFLIDENEISVIRNDIDTFNEAVYFREIAFSKSIYDKYKNQYDRLFYSLVCIDFVLMGIVYEAVYEKKYDQEALEQIGAYIDYFSISQKQKYNLIKGHNLFHKLHITEAKEHLLKNLEYQVNPKAAAMSASLLALCSKRLFYAYDAIDYGKRASQLHGEQASLYRKLEADANVINVLIDINRFSEAQRMLNTLTMTIDPTDEETHNIQRYLHFLQSYLFFRQNKHEKAFAILSDHYINVPSYHFYKAEILIAMERTKEAIQVLKKSLSIKTVQEDLVYFHLNSILLFKLSGDYDPDLFEQYASKLLKNLHKIEDFPVFKYIFSIIIEFYQKQRKYQKALDSALKYFNYAQKGYEMHQKKI